MRAKWKRSTQEFGQYSLVGKLGIETLYLGKRPNVFRFYDKIAEFHHQYARLKRQSGASVPPFEQAFGFPETGAVLTRAERQIGGSRIPEEIATVGRLECLPEFDPDDRLEIMIGSAVPPNPDNYSFTTYLQGLGLRQFVLQSGGIQNARRLANRLSKKQRQQDFHQAGRLPTAPGLSNYGERNI